MGQKNTLLRRGNHSLSGPGGRLSHTAYRVARQALPRHAVVILYGAAGGCVCKRDLPFSFGEIILLFPFSPPATPSLVCVKSSVPTRFFFFAQVGFLYEAGEITPYNQ